MGLRRCLDTEVLSRSTPNAKSIIPIHHAASQLFMLEQQLLAPVGGGVASYADTWSNRGGYELPLRELFS